MADEKMLFPVLEFIPNSVNKLNITMGSSLRNTHLYSFFDAFFQLHINREKLGDNKTKFYFQDLFRVWQHPAFQNSESTKSLEKLKNRLQKQNLSFPSKEDVLNSCESDILPWINALLNYQKSNPIGIIDNALNLTSLIKNEIVAKGRKNSLDLEYLFAFAKLFNQIKNLQDKYGFIKELNTIHHLFQHSVKH